ncbi:MAG TPA: hypothetical protein VFG10_07505 [Saprospiraceae bacterium]|nr:hypothetical protein [Saprospiraceae bacterium]
MPNRSTDPLFQLIQSLQKHEKRNFKLYMQRNSAKEDMKVIQLFDALETMNEYDEDVLLKKANTLKKQQLSNAKAHLYKQILASLRLLESSNIEILLNEQLDNARILYNKGLYQQSLKLLDKVKETARAHNQAALLVQVLFLEKKIETLHITRSFKDRSSQLINEADNVNAHIIRITKLSNLALQLYSWYINNGHARNEKDETEVEEYFQAQMSEDLKKANGFYEKLYLYQCNCWYAFIRQDFLAYYRNTQHWVDLFHHEALMMEIETASYIKGMHNLLTSHFMLRNDSKFEKDLRAFDEFSVSDIVKRSDNNRVQVFLYLYIARINQHILTGTFNEGLLLVPVILEKLNEFQLYIDSHRILVYYYKIASLYFGAGDFDNSIDYLNKIINWKVDLRNDLQCYARLLHLIAHYELGNYDLLEYLVKSVYRYMYKMENLSVVEEEMFRFLQKSFHLSARELKPEFVKLLQKIKQIEKSRFETRALVYLDVVSWLESKVYEKPLHEIIREKYWDRQRKG